jgi:NADPH:quinone reductase-like Zn-dependent oxidoreductase
MSPILSASLWDKVLQSTGFSGRELDIHDCEPDDIYTFSVIMSTAISGQMETSICQPIVLVTSVDSPSHDDVWLKTLQESVAAATNKTLVTTESIRSVDAAGKFCIFLGDLEQSILHNPSVTEFGAIVKLALCCKGLLWVTRGGSIDCTDPRQAMSSGFLRTLRLENTTNNYISLDLDPQTHILGPREAAVISKIVSRAMNTSFTHSSLREFEFSERSGTILIPRLFKDFARNEFISRVPTSFRKTASGSFAELGGTGGRCLKLEIDTSSLLETLTFKEISQCDTLMDPDFIEIEPKAFGLNFRDVMAAMGQLNERIMGLECSGVVTRVGSSAASHGFSAGCHAITLLDGKCQSRIRVPWTAACPTSQSDFNTAASIPMIFVTAYVSLYDTAKLCKGQSILIHAATGGVGQAAIILAQHLGAEVFATAGSSEKRKFLTSKYGIPEDHVFSSRDDTFLPKLMSITGGLGVNVVLNCLSGKLLQQSFNCLAPFGHFVEIGKFDLEQNHYLELAPFTRAVSFSSIDILALLRLGSPIIHQTLTIVTRLLDQGLIRPVDPVSVFPISDIEKAFHHMQTGKHMGKIILSVNDCIIPVSRANLLH